MASGRFTLRTPLGERPDPTEEDVSTAIAAARAIDGGFAVLERDDGAYVQFDGSVLEWNPGARLQRLEVGPQSEDAFRRFLRGGDVSTSLPWRDVQALLEAEERAGRRARTRRIVALLAGIALLLLIRSLL